MSYRTVTAALRENLGELFHIRQPALAIRGVSSLAADQSGARTEQEQEELAELVQRYRQVVLGWVGESAGLAMEPTVRSTLDPVWGSARLFVNRLERVVETTPGGLPTGEELGTASEVPFVEAWRRAAAAVVIERELLMPREEVRIDTKLARTRGEVEREEVREHVAALPAALRGMTPGERAAILKDAADFTRALVILDDRAHAVPGWQHIGGFRHSKFLAPGERISFNTGLNRAAVMASRSMLAQDPDYVIDDRGHHPGLTADRSTPYGPGAGEAARALRNGLTTLNGYPRTQALRSLVLAHVGVSTEAARLAKRARDVGGASYFTARAEAYRNLSSELRNVAGLLGDRAGAAVQDTIAATAVLKDAKDASRADLVEVRRAAAATDQHLAAIVRTGARRAVYAVTLRKHLDPNPLAGVRNAIPVWERIDGQSHPVLLETADQLKQLGDRGTPPPISVAADGFPQRAPFLATVQKESLGRSQRAALRVEGWPEPEPEAPLSFEEYAASTPTRWNPIYLEEPDMPMLSLYHRTTSEAAATIVAEGRFVTQENTPEAYVSTRAVSDATEGYGDAVVHVRVRKSLAELEDEFPDGEQHFRIPLDRAQVVGAFTVGDDGQRTPITAGGDAELHAAQARRAIGNPTPAAGAVATTPEQPPAAAAPAAGYAVEQIADLEADR